MSEWKTISVPLEFPINTGTEIIDKIELREPDLDALEAIEALDMVAGKAPKLKQIRLLITALSRIDPEILGKLHVRDVTKLGEAVVPLVTA